MPNNLFQPAPEAPPAAEAPIPSAPERPRAEGPVPTPALAQRQTAAIRHGLHVRAPSGLRLRDRRTRRLVRKVWRQLPWLQPSDQAAVRAWAEMEILCANAAADLFTNGALKDGRPRDLLDAYRRLRRDQLQFAKALGMTPAARAELGLTLADMDLATSQGAALRTRLTRALRAEAPTNGRDTQENAHDRR